MMTLNNIRFFLSLGGLLGFTIAFASGLLAHNEIGVVLRDASIGCLFGALLMRGFLAVLHHSLREMEAEKGKETPALDDKSDEKIGVHNV